jgi:hypothetical protein
MCGYKFQYYYYSKSHFNNDSPEEVVIKEEGTIRGYNKRFGALHKYITDFRNLLKIKITNKLVLKVFKAAEYFP